MSSSTTSTSTPTCTGSSTRRSGGSSPRSAIPAIRARCARGRSSSAAPTTARWACPTAGCARRCSTPTRRRSTSRSSSPTRPCSPNRPRPMPSPRSSTSCRPCSPWPVGRTRESRDGLRGRDLTPILAAAARPERERAGASAVDLSPILDHPAPAASVQDAVHFTYDDHQAATAMQEAPGQPNRIRAIRTRDAQVRLVLRPAAVAPPEYEMYDLERDPIEARQSRRGSIGASARLGRSRGPRRAGRAPGRGDSRLPHRSRG